MASPTTMRSAKDRRANRSPRKARLQSNEDCAVAFGMVFSRYAVSHNNSRRARSCPAPRFHYSPGLALLVLNLARSGNFLLARAAARSGLKFPEM
jgi:hypothetical protein